MARKIIPFTIQIYEDDIPGLDRLLVLLNAYVSSDRKIPPVLVQKVASILTATRNDENEEIYQSIWKAHRDAFRLFEGKEHDFVTGRKKAKGQSYGKIILLDAHNPFSPSFYKGNRPLRHIFLRVITELYEERHKKPAKLSKHNDQIRFCYLKFREIIKGEYKRKISDYVLAAMAGSIAFSLGWRYNNDEETDVNMLFEKAYPSVKNMVRKDKKRPRKKP